MKKNQLLSLSAFTLITVSLTLNSCSKGGDGGGSGGGTPPTTCPSITVTPTVTQVSDACSSTGIVSVTATGSTGFTFNIDNGAYQATGTFNNVAPGNHTFGVKSAAGCTQTASISVGTVAAGAKFAAVKALLAANCAVSGCHNGTQSPNFTVDCNIVSAASQIKFRAVDQAGTASQMPQPPRTALVQADRDKISTWVAAGGKFTD